MGDWRLEMGDGMKFEDLKAWQEARRLVNAIYGITRSRELAKDFGLSSQVQRAAVSSMTNIAEGFEREGKAEKINFYRIARASTGEVRSLLYVIEDNYSKDADKAANLRNEAESVGRLISGLIASTQRRSFAKKAVVVVSLLLPTYLATRMIS